MNPTTVPARRPKSQRGYATAMVDLVARMKRSEMRGESQPGFHPGYMLRRHQVAQHVLQNPAVLEVIELIERIDAAEERHALEATVGRDDFGHQLLARLQLAVQAANGHLL